MKILSGLKILKEGGIQMVKLIQICGNCDCDTFTVKDEDSYECVNCEEVWFAYELCTVAVDIEQ